MGEITTDMNSIAQDLVTTIERTGKTYTIPPIRDIYVAPGERSGENNSNFGFIVLEDGTVGLTYVAMGAARVGIRTAISKLNYKGMSPIELAHWYVGEPEWQRALGLAAINAVSQYSVRQSERPMPEVRHTIELLDLAPGDHVGMIGYFPPLVGQIGALGIPLTVIELDEQWLRQDDNLEVTLDPACLSKCTKVLCTGTTLVNHTLDSVLAHSAKADRFCLIGPTASCLPEPLFERGVTMACGCQVTDSKRFIELWSRGQRWRDATRRYVLQS
jgi:uncharacterized protein (DUF4213/DUF364 family)